MTRFIDAGTRVVVQGATGTQGRFHTRLMLEYGTKVVAGVTPGKGGGQVEGLPVYDTVREAQEAHGAEASIVFVPAAYALEAGLEALEAGMNPVAVVTEGMPFWDSVYLVAKAREVGATLVGPNSPGVIKAGEAKLGIMPGRVFQRGSVGIISRSGTLFYEVAHQLTKRGLGQSTCVGLGGDPVVGLDYVEVLRWMEEDSQTRAVVLIGEIGGVAEEEAARFIEEGGFTKPVVAYIAGRSAVPGKRMGHAGAIVQGGGGTAESKIKALERAGVYVAERPSLLAERLKETL